MVNNLRDVTIVTRTLDMMKNSSTLNNHTPRKFHHWAVRVGNNQCWEVNHADNNPKVYGMFTKNFSDWKKRDGNTLSASQFYEIPVGKTKFSDQQITECAQEIWTEVYKQKYQSQFQNCQEFAIWLLRCTVDGHLDESNISDRFLHWYPLSPLTTLVAQAGIVGVPTLAYDLATSSSSGNGREKDQQMMIKGGLLLGATAATAYTISVCVEQRERFMALADIELRWRRRMGYRGATRRRMRDEIAQNAANSVRLLGNGMREHKIEPSR